ncbi:cation:proton antiporter [Zavarzinia compransoris]|uniref:Cation transporter n=1 Tax=Zavarzinia compransoris TaxID=1264899 RepID=A0A317EB18_9PROT|nr:cation:proton antiporter [Zavarzinia compransoris]PWR23396.1 cation transporter [Zavarzinia compransoris]TDP46029.1 Kef-type potassium/proton antiporter (CPA2 family) [Zavarzinia compransoris]
MPHDTSLIATVAIGFVIAFIFGFFANKLRLPPLIGYLIAGVAVGPFTPGFVADAGLATQLAEIGVILLMFGVGLHFSASDLMAVRWIALPGAIAQIGVATALGIGIAQIWGWSLGAGIVFGLSLSVASTVVLLKALEERNAVNGVNGRIAVGWLIVEDLAMVLALVLLPAFAEALGGTVDGAHGGETAGGGTGLWLGLAITLGKVAAFVALALLLGPRVVPWVLAQVARTGSRELFTLSVLAIALGIAFGSAVLFGVSFALGAFFAGVVLNESDFSHKAASESMPLQDAFSVLFFVSVGMLFDPMVLINEPLSVLVVLAIIVVGKTAIAAAIVLALGYPMATALTVSAALAQIGEFSFILAGLGIGLKLMPAEGQDLILAGALLSITLNPLVFYAMDRLAKKLVPAEGEVRGAANLRSLERELMKAHIRQEAREAEKVLKAQQLAESFPMFAKLDPHERHDLLSLFKHRTANPGERLIRKGDRAESVFFIAAGRVQVDIADARIKLGPGEHFGEMALLSGERRSADVTALDYCQFFTLDKRDFRHFMTTHPQVKRAFEETAEARRAMNAAQSEEALP